MNDAEHTPDPDPAADQERLFARLDRLGIVTRTVRHPPVFTVAENQALRGDLPGGHCKTLYLREKKGGEFLVVALEDRQIDLKALRHAIGGRNLSFGSAERLWARLRVRPGSVTPLALINADDAANTMAVVLDTGLAAHQPLHFHPLSNDATTAIEWADLIRFVEDCGFQPRLVDLATVQRAE